MVLVVADSDLLTANGNFKMVNVDLIAIKRNLLIVNGDVITTGINSDLLMVNVGFDWDDDG